MRRRSSPPSIQAGTESYLESLSDLLIGVLFIFLIILMGFSLSLRVSQEENQIAERQLTIAQRQLTDQTQLRADLLTAMSRRMSKRGVFIDIEKQNGILRLPEELLFPSGSDEFSPQGRAAVAIVARELAAELPCYAQFNKPGRLCPPDAHPILDAVLIEGHTDDVPIKGGPFKDNWELSASRSRKTYDALTAGAPELKNILNTNSQPLLSISAYGSTRMLKGYGNPKENRKHSRRIDLRFIIGTPKLEKP